MIKIDNLSNYLLEQKTKIYKKQEDFEEILFPFKLLAWKKLSENLLLPLEHNYHQFLKNKKNKVDFFEIVKFFSESDDAKNFRIFLPSDIKFLRKYSEHSLISFINRANMLENYPDIDEFFDALNKNIIHLNLLSNEIVNFLADLLAIHNTLEVYNPYPDNYHLAIKINKKLNIPVFTEDRLVTSLPYILNTLFDANLNIAFSEPLTNPSYNEGYVLRSFDTVISYPPMFSGSNVNLKKDIYNRFNNMEIIRTHPVSVYIMHILAQTKNKAYVLVPINFLSRSFSADIEFRKMILNINLISDVILLPGNIFNKIAIDHAIIIFDKQKKDKYIHLIDATYFQKNSYEYLSEQIMDLLKNKIQESEFSYLSHIDEIAKNNFSLNPKHYIESKKITSIFRNAEFIKLMEKVEIISSPVIKRKKGILEVYELQPTDIDDYGIINRPKNKSGIQLTEVELSKAELRNFDILLVTKGIKDTINKVGIVINKPDNETWVAGQCLTVLRPSSIKDAKALFMFLMTDIAKAMLNSLVSGAFIHNISAKSLKEMKIPKLDSEKLEFLYEEFLKKYQEIEKITTEMKQLQIKTLELISRRGLDFKNDL